MFQKNCREIRCFLASTIPKEACIIMEGLYWTVKPSFDCVIVIHTSFIPLLLKLLPSSLTPCSVLLSSMLSWPGVAMSCPAIQTALAQQPQVAPAALQLRTFPRPNTTAAGPARPTSNSFFSECTEVCRIIFFFSSEAPGVGSLAAESCTSTFPSPAAERLAIMLICA